MRFIVLLFGFVSITLTAFVGVMFLTFATFLEILKQDLGAGKEIVDFVEQNPLSTSHGETGLFLIISAGYGFLGVMLSFFRCGWQGALLMLIPVVCAVIMNPISGIFAGPQIFTAFLSFLVFPLPINAPKKDAGDEVEADD